MTSKSEFINYIIEQLDPMGEVIAKRLFGGYALCLNDIPFALAFKDSLYFKVNDTNRADYEAHGSQPFTYQKQGKTVIISNWEVPADIIEDQTALLEWANKAYAVGISAKKPTRKK